MWAKGDQDRKQERAYRRNGTSRESSDDARESTLSRGSVWNEIQTYVGV